VWGDGDCGQLGLGEETTERLRPWPLQLGGGADDVLQVACGGMHTVALTADGAVWTWGVNDEGALGRKTSGESAKKLWAAAGHGAAPDSDPYVPGVASLPAGAGRVVMVTAGDSHTCALDERGTVWSWGTFRDSSGVMGFAPGTRTQVAPAPVFGPGSPACPGERCVKVASGDDHVVALCESGRVYSWGNGQQGQLARVGERLAEARRLPTYLTPTRVHVASRAGRVTDVACGSYSTFLVLGGGAAVLAAGLNNYGQLGLEAPEGCQYALARVRELEGCAEVAPGQHHTLGVRDGALVAVGRTTYGRLGRADVDAGADGRAWAAGEVAALAECAPVGGAAAGLAVSGCFGGPEGRLWLWGMGGALMANGDEDEDLPAPARVKETKKFNGWRCVMLGFGGQHAAFLGVRREGYRVPEGAE